MQALACAHSAAEVIWAAGPHSAMACASLLRLLAAVAAAAVLLCCGADAVSVHTVFTTECRPYFTWQSLGARAVCLCLQARRTLHSTYVREATGLWRFSLPPAPCFLELSRSAGRRVVDKRLTSLQGREVPPGWLAGFHAQLFSAPGQARRAS